MKFISKSFVQPGNEIEATDEEDRKYYGIVEQSNSDGAMIVKLKGLPFSEFVWAPVPEAPAIAKKIEISQDDLDAYYAEIKRRDQVESALNAIINELQAQLAAIPAPVPAAESAPVEPVAPAVASEVKEVSVKKK